jgi:hypothetical protein
LAKEVEMDDPNQNEETNPRSYRRGDEPSRRPPPEIPTNHYTDLPDCPADSPLATEWNLYRRLVHQLLAEGHEGKWLLIKNQELVGIWDTEAEANGVRVTRFAREPVLMKQILAREPILRIGYNRLCRS